MTATPTPVTPAARSAKNATSATRSGRLFVLELNAGRIHLMNTDGSDQKTMGRILRAGVDIPKGETAANRSDIEVFFDRLPEPIDLEFDLNHRMLYWTDRGDPPRGNTVNRASIDAK